MRALQEDHFDTGEHYVHTVVTTDDGSVVEVMGMPLAHRQQLKEPAYWQELRGGVGGVGSWLVLRVVVLNGVCGWLCNLPRGPVVACVYCCSCLIGAVCPRYPSRLPIAPPGVS